MRRPFLLAALSAMAAPAALAGPYEFLPAPQTDLNRIYRLDRHSGELTACQYGLKEGSIGVTLCYGAGEGAGLQPAGDYGLVASRHDREGGVFRVNHRTGEMSVCYVFNDHVVCTPQAKASPVQQGQVAPATQPETTGSAAGPPAAPSPAARRN
jgi:hypothetical protein